MPLSHDIYIYLELTFCFDDAVKGSWIIGVVVTAVVGVESASIAERKLPK